MMNSQVNAVLTELYSKANQKNVEEMKRFGIKSTNKVLGIPSKPLFAIAKNIGTNHELALELWKTGVYEARILSILTADPKKINKSTMNSWAKDFDNWAICDGACLHCFCETPYGHDLARKWVNRKEEFVRRAGFSLIACMCIHDKISGDEVFIKYLSTIKKYAIDERNFVKKAVNWALRQIGKKNLKLNAAAIKTAEQIHKLDSSSAKWIATDALRELRSTAVINRLKKWEKKNAGSGRKNS